MNRAVYKIDANNDEITHRVYPVALYERAYAFGVIPYWARITFFASVSEAEEHLREKLITTRYYDATWRRI